MKYLLDANTVMEASRQYYGFDTAPGFWSWLEEPTIHDRVGSITAVRDEIRQGDGDLVEWAKRIPNSFWIDEHEDLPSSLAAAMQWATNPSRPYTAAAKNEFANSADLQLIAAAHANNATVVTREVAAPQSKRRVKIPDVCLALGVQCIQPFEAFRKLGLCLII